MPWGSEAGRSDFPVQLCKHLVDTWAVLSLNEVHLLQGGRTGPRAGGEIYLPALLYNLTHSQMFSFSQWQMLTPSLFMICSATITICS